MKHLRNTHYHLFNLSSVGKRIIKIVPAILLLVMFASCNSVRVAADYDKDASFSQYKTFAFFKPGIDRAEVSDLDKRRILRAIEAELMAKGLMKSENPDILVNIFTKSQQRVDVYNNNWGWGGWGGWGWGGFGGWGWGGMGGWNQQPMVSTTTEGTLYIDLVEANNKELIWQGMGTGYLSQKMEKKEARIQEFVSKVMEKYPPAMNN